MISLVLIIITGRIHVLDLARELAALGGMIWMGRISPDNESRIGSMAG
jgi:hypothetical protein